MQFLKQFISRSSLLYIPLLSENQVVFKNLKFFYLGTIFI